MEMIPLVAPYYTLKDNIGKAFEDDSEVRAFEEEFAAYVGCRGAVAVNSGTDALIVASRAMGMPPGFQVPSFACRALLDAIAYDGSNGNIVDNICDIPRADFSATFTEDTDLALMLPHMFGTASMVPNDELVIEDITLSLGAVNPDKIGVCSFHRDKMISTGRGGIIVAQDDGFLERCRELAYYDQPRNGTYTPAFSFGMSGMQAALGRSQLKQLPGFIERRRDVAARYTAVFREVGIETPDPDVESTFFRYIIGVTDPGAKVAQLAERGIEAGRGVDPPLHRLVGLRNEDFPGAEECYSKLLSVPVHPGLSDEQVGYIIEQVVQGCAP